MAKWKEEKNIRKAYVMVGLPYSGKSTHIKHIIEKEGENNCHIMSFDDTVKDWCDENDLTIYEFYENSTQMPSFVHVNKMLDKLMRQKVTASKLDVLIVDKTNTTSKQRTKLVTWLKQLGYEEIIYVVFPKPSNSKEAKNWLARQNKRLDRIVSDLVLINFFQIFEYPDIEKEKFDKMVVMRDTWK